MKVTYTPDDDTSIRKIVQADLVKLEIQFKGLGSESIGDWSGSIVSDYEAERGKILGRLRRGAIFA